MNLERAELARIGWSLSCLPFALSVTLRPLVSDASPSPSASA